MIERDPAGAMKTISAKYPGEPVKVAETIEKCVAPTGEPCDRLAKIVHAIPSMMGDGAKTPDNDSVASTCRGMPPEMQQCMLPSYNLAHADACKKIYDSIAASAVEAKLPTEKPCDGGVVSALITKKGVWIGAAEGKGCFGPAGPSGQPDSSWTEATLQQFAKPGCRPSVEIAAQNDVQYESVIRVMDLAVKVGLTDVAYASTTDLTHSSDTEHAPAQCEAVTPTGTTHVTPSTPGRAKPPTPGKPLEDSVVLVITKTEISVAGTIVGDVEAIAEGTGDIEALTKALPPKTTDVMVILQADASTPASVITRVVETSKHAGYINVLFAVKSK